jgi:hypothetical protein
MERTGIEPVTSGLQTHPIARPHLTPVYRIGMTEPNQPFRRTTLDTVRRRPARTALARPLPKWATEQLGPTCLVTFSRATALDRRSSRLRRES